MLNAVLKNVQNMESPSYFWLFFILDGNVDLVVWGAGAIMQNS